VEQPLDQARNQTMPDLLRSIIGDTSTLMKKEAELAKAEIVEGVTARLKAVVSLAAAGILGLLALVFLALSAAVALDAVVTPWASRLIVAGGFLLLLGVAVLFGLRRMKSPSLAPEQTKRTVKEDVEWARHQLRR